VFPVTDYWNMACAPTAGKAADRAAHVFGLAANWMFSAPMGYLLAEFGEQLPGAGAAGNGDTDDWTSWLHLNEELPGWLDRIVAGEAAHIDGLSAAQTDILRRTLAVERMAADDFNFRTRTGQQYRERSQAVTGDFTSAFRARVHDLTDQLGLVSPQQPRFGSYDKTLVLGGGYQSPLLRARYAAQLRAAGTSLGEVSFLGSPRFLIEQPPERPVAETYAPGAADEFDLMVGAAKAEFGLTAEATQFLCGCTSPQAQCPRWPGRSGEAAPQTPPAYTHERRVDLVDSTGRAVGMALSASTGRPPYRPDTTDTFALWARCASPQRGQRVLVVTTQVFVPFQTFDGLKRLYLQHGADIDVVGYPAEEWGYPSLTAEYLLQETLSAIRSGRRLLIDASQTLMAAPSPA
jgi:hypothetical protein